MSPKPRNSLNLHRIKNLYIKRDTRSKTGFSCQYKDPRFGDPRFPDAKKQFHSLGSNVETAKEEATTLNAVLYGQIASAKVNRIIAKPSNTCTGIQLKEWIEQYLLYCRNKLKNGDMKPNTFRTKKNIVQAIENAHGQLFFADINVLQIDELINSYVNAGKNRMAQSVRSVYIDIYKVALGKGIPYLTQNVADKTLNPTAKVQRERLTFEHFEKIINAYTYKPHKLSALLAVMTGQRRTDLCLMRKTKGKDWDERYKAYRRNPNHFVKGEYTSFANLVQYAPYSFIEKDQLCIFQLKTGNLLRIPLSLTMNKLGLSVGEVINQANLFAFSPFVLHHITARAQNKKGDPLHADTVSRAFARAVKATGIKYTLNQPTFHELRSLAEREYREQGINTQKLLGHKREAMTEVYNDVRGCDWSKVAAV
ncbi:tyrosine-type recombinase/integrase [Colwellia sp. E150_009]